MTAKLNPLGLSVTDLVKALQAAGARHVSKEYVRSHIEAGAPTNADGTINLVQYAAWLAGKLRTRGENVLALTQGQAAQLIGIARTNLARMHVPDGVRSPQTRLYDGPALVHWRWGELERRIREEFEMDDTQGSPALEKYREEKFREARRRNELEEQTLIPVEEVRGVIAAATAAFRSEAEAIERSRGRDVGDEIRAMVERLIAGLNRSDPAKTEEVKT